MIRTRHQETIMFDSQHEGQPLRVLNDSELDAVTGGSIDSWLAGQPTIAVPPLDLGWTFKDVFAKYTIGR